jgi:hypothetical protein
VSGIRNAFCPKGTTGAIPSSPTRTGCLGEFRYSGRCLVDPPQAWGRPDLNDLRKEYREYSQRESGQMLQLPQLLRWLARRPSRRDADGSAPSTARGRARIATSHRTGCRRSSWRALVTRPSTCSIAGTLSRGWTEINLQAMLGTEYTRERDSIWPPYCSKPIGQMDRPGRANRS